MDCTVYRVRAPNDRSQLTIAPGLQAHHKSEAIELRTIVVIIRLFSRVLYRLMQLLLSI